MTKFIYFIALFFIVQTTIAQDQINFSKSSFKQLLKLSKNDHKDIMIYFGVKDNKVCTDFEKNFFSQKGLAVFYNKSFHNYRVNLESTEGKKLVKQFKINAYPSIIFYSSKKEISHKVVGINSDYDGLQMGENVMRKTKTLLYYQYLIKNNPEEFRNNPLMMLEYCDILYDAGEDYHDPIITYFNTLDTFQLQEPVNIDAIVKYSNELYRPEFIFLARNYTHLHGVVNTSDDLFIKVESVVSSHLLKVFKDNKNIPMQDTLQSTLDFLQIRSVEAFRLKVYLDYYKYITNDMVQYFNTLQKYMPFHISFLSPTDIGDICSEIAESDIIINTDLYNEALIWIEDASNRNESLELNYIKVQLLVKTGRNMEAKDMIQMIRDMFKDEITPEWEKRLKEVGASNSGTDEVEIELK